MTFTNPLQSVLNAEKRWANPAGFGTCRRMRSDRGKSRLPKALALRLKRLLSGQERPSIKEILSALESRRNKAARVPSRATVYHFMNMVRTRLYHPDEIPPAAKAALYNLDSQTPVPGHQLAFYCFNYGELAAMSFAAGLPWLCLYQAAHLRGFRHKSRGLLQAVLRVRGI